MTKKMVTTQPGLFIFTDKDSAFQVTETGATINGKGLTMSEAWAWLMDAIAEKAIQPDPSTGLVPCGCGGKARIEESPFADDVDNVGLKIYMVGCAECTIGFEGYFTSSEDAQEHWNRAMSGGRQWLR